MEKQQAEFADSPMLKFSTFSAGLRQWCFLKVSEPEVHRCGEFGPTRENTRLIAGAPFFIHCKGSILPFNAVFVFLWCAETEGQTYF